MMDSALRSFEDMRRKMEVMFARREAEKAKLALLQAEFESVQKDHEAVRKSIEQKKQENSFLIREIEMLQARKKSQKEQTEMLEHQVRIQLPNELKKAKEQVKNKKEKYKSILDKYQKIWEEYEVEYNKFPRVAERNELAIKLKILKINAMKKKQEMLEKRKQVQQLKEIKAQRAEVLRSEFQKWCAIEQEKRLEYEDLSKRIKEAQERIAAKKAKKLEEQQKLEEERQRELQEELQQQATREGELLQESSQAENPVVQSSQAPTFIIPTLTLPDFDSPLKSLSQGSRLASLQVGFPSKLRGPMTSVKSLSQPTKHTSMFVPHSLSSNPFPFEKTATAATNVFKIGGGMHEYSSHLTPNTDDQRNNLLEGNRDLPSKLPGNDCHQSVLSGSAPENKERKSMLSTENILPKNPVTVPLMAKPSEDEDMIRSSLPSKTSKEVQSDSKEFPQNEGSAVSSHQPSESHAVGIELIKTIDTKCQQLDQAPSNDQSQQKSFDVCDAAHSTASSSKTNENIHQQSEDQENGFISEFGEEMYNSLGSPPPFDTVTSPVYAGFDTSPVRSFEENLKATDDEAPASFTGFGFFPRAPAANIFGGPSASDSADKEKSGLNFSFFF